MPFLRVEHSFDGKSILFEGDIRLSDYTLWSKPFLTYLDNATALHQTCIRFSKDCKIDEGSLMAIADLVAWHNHTHENKRQPCTKDASFQENTACDRETIYAFESLHTCFRASDKTMNRKIILDDSLISQRLRTTLKDREHYQYLEKKRILTTLSSTRHTSFFKCVHTSLWRIFQTTQQFFCFFGNVLVKSIQCAYGKLDFPTTSLFYHLYHVGLLAVPIIALISFLIGMVLAYQGINQLQRFGAEIYAIDFLTIGVFREIGALLTAVVVAGRSSSAFTAHIGTMSLNQELDALNVMQLDSILYLVLPRVLSLIISLPLLVFLSDIMALLGGMLTTFLVIDVSPIQFLTYLQRAFTPATFWVGMSKAPLFALLIGLVGCFRGVQVRGSAESVGRLTTTSVVEAIFLVIIANAFMSLVFSYLKI